MLAVEAIQCEGQQDQRDNAGAERRRESVYREKKSRHTGQDSGQYEEGGQSWHPVRAKHADQHKDAASDRQQTDNDVDDSKVVNRQAENHSDLRAKITDTPTPKSRVSARKIQ